MCQFHSCLLKCYEAVEQVLAELKDNGFLWNSLKCIFKVKQIKFLRHKSSHTIIEPLEVLFSILIVQRFQVSKTREEILSLRSGGDLATV